MKLHLREYHCTSLMISQRWFRKLLENDLGNDLGNAAGGHQAII